MQAQEKMIISHKGIDYEGIPAASAVGMALFESLGLGVSLTNAVNSIRRRGLFRRAW